jgi:hypothetical protein
MMEYASTQILRVAEFIKWGCVGVADIQWCLAGGRRFYVVSICILPT